MSETTFKKIKKQKYVDKNIVIGIDLGTTNSCAGIWANNKVEIIPNKLGYRTTPSMVCFLENKTLIGNAAKFEASKYPYLTISDTKRLIGRKFSEEEVQNDIKTFPFKVTKDKKDNPIIQIEINNNIIKTFTPCDISAIILKQIKKDIEDFLEKDIKDVVITVPAYFNDLQREETRNAAIIAGFKVLRIIKEPIAAALAYNLYHGDNKIILVFDLGGGTFDVSILKLENNILKVISTKGDNHLGGNDFDNKLVDFCVEKFKEEYNVDLKINDNDDDKEIKKKKKSLYRLKIACEKAKIDLSNMENTSINIDLLYDKYDFQINILRNEFESICEDLINKCFICVDELLSNKNIIKNKIDEILLIGGSSKIPKIREMVKKYFNKEPKKLINPDEIVAYGAVIQGSIIVNSNINGKNMALLDKIPFPFGVANIEGKMVDLIQEESDIPISRTKTFYTPYDDATSVKIVIYEGPYEDVIDNYKIGEFDLLNLPKKRKGEIEIKVTFDIDVNNILHVSAKYIEGNISNEITIANDRNVCFKDSIEKIEKLFIENNIVNYIGEIIKYEKKYNSSNDLSDLQQLISSLEDIINSFEKNINDNKTMLQKYNHYINALFRKYNSFLEKQGGNNIEIKNKIIKYFKQVLKNELDIKELINIFNQNSDIKLSLLIEYMQFYLDKGIKYEKDNKKEQAIQFFNEGLNLCYFQNILGKEILKINNIKEKFKKIYNLLFFNLKKNQAKIIYDIGECYLKKGDETNDIEEYINAIDNYRKAYSILKEKVPKNICNSNSLYESYNKLEDRKEVKKSNFSQNSFYCTIKLTDEDEEKYKTFDYELEAKIIYKIVFITYEKFKNSINLSGLKERLLICKDYLNKINNNNKNDLYEKVKTMIIKIEKEIEEIKENDKNIQELKKKMKERYPRIFKQLEEMESKSKEEYIKFILNRYPYSKKENCSIDVDKCLRENQIQFIDTLFTKYFPDVHPRETEEEKKYYCIFSKIDAHLSCIKSELETLETKKKKKK